MGGSFENLSLLFILINMELEEILKNNLNNNKEFILEELKEGRITFDAGYSSNYENLFNSLFEFLKFLSEWYPGRVNLNLMKGYENDPHIISSVSVYIGDFTIVNNLEQSHHIKDLYVRINIHKYRNEYLYIGSLDLMRTTLTSKELVCGYVHSHVGNRRDILSDINKGKDVSLTYNSICLGNNPIRNYLNNKRLNEFTRNDFEGFMMHLMSILTYESIETNPYLYFVDVYNSTLLGANFRVLSYGSLKDCIKNIINNLPNYTDSLEFDVDRTGIILKKSQKLEDLLLKMVKDIYGNSSRYEDFVCYKTDSGYCKVFDKSLIKISEDAGEPEIKTYETSSNLYFRGKKLKLKVIQEPNTVTKEVYDNLVEIIHPEILEMIIKIIQFRVNTKYIQYALQ